MYVSNYYDLIQGHEASWGIVFLGFFFQNGKGQSFFFQIQDPTAKCGSFQRWGLGMEEAEFVLKFNSNSFISNFWPRGHTRVQLLERNF